MRKLLFKQIEKHIDAFSYSENRNIARGYDGAWANKTHQCTKIEEN